VSELRYEYDDDPNDSFGDSPVGDGDAAGGDQVFHRLIRASAGAGKTYQLTQHVLKLLRRGAALDTILATTFTRKAAGEILGRLITTLAQQADGSEPDPASPGTRNEKPAKQLLAELTANLHRVAVSTIDSFFSRLGSSFQYELDLPLEPRMIDEGSATAAQLRAEAIEAVLADAAADNQTFVALLALLRRLHHDQASRSVTRAIDQIVVDHAEVYRRAPDPETWSRLTATGLLDAAQLSEAIEQWRQMQSELPVTKAGTPRKNWKNSWIKIGQQAVAGDWEHIADSGILSFMLDGKDAYGGAEFSAAWIDAAAPLLNHTRGLLIQRIAHQTQATYELMGQFAHRYDQLRRQRGVMLYSDLTHRLARGEMTAGSVDDDQLLSEIHFRLDRAVTHLLLDEFQDTSLDQWTVLSPFAEEVAAASDGSRSLFVVGDTKQAIYGWRGGCVELFDAVAFLVPSAGRQTLAESRRSSPVVLDAVNTVFADLDACPTFDSDKYPEDREAAALWSARFEPHQAFYEDLPGFVSFETSGPSDTADDENEFESDDLDSDDDNNDAAPAAASSHERGVARRIAELYRTMPSRSLGVLVSTNGAVNRLLYELRKEGLPASGEGGNPIADTPAVAAVLSALQLADHPSPGKGERDTAASFHVRNSPLGPILKLESDREAWRVAEQIRASLLTAGYAATIARWVGALAEHCDAVGLSKLTRLVELAERYEAEPGEALRPGRFVDYVESTRVEEPSSADIRVMTIHKSKGLEFDAVVLPEIDRKLGNKFAVLIDQPDPTGPIEAVYRYAGESARAASPELAATYAQQRRRRRQEDLCALYVAMTRARQGLYLIGKPLVKPDGKMRKPGLCFAGILRDTLGDPDDGPITWGEADWMTAGAKNDGSDSQSAKTPASPNVLSAKLAADRPSRRMRPTVSPSQLHGQGKVSADELLKLESAAVRQARQRGTDIHSQLEQIDYLDGQRPPDESIPAVRDALAHAAVRAVFAPRFGLAEKLWAERSFVVPDGKRLLKGKFDRVVLAVNDSGQATAAHLIDFKTDRVAEGSDALAQRVESYRPQAEAYRRALSLMLGLDESAITAELLFTTPGVTVAV